MATFLNTLSTATEAVSAISSFLFGASGDVVLGSFSFSGFEVPEEVTIPGSHQLVVHRFIGGDRQIDAMGDNPGCISWNGVMIDGNPWERAQELEQMRAAGNALPLQWGPFFYTVVIRDFECKTPYSRAAYKISCEVLRNEATAQQDADPSLTQTVTGDIASALGIAPTQLTGAITTAQQGVAALGQLIPGSPALAQASALAGSVGASLSNLANASGALIGNVTNSASLTSMLTNSGLAAQAQQALSYVNRTIKNLS